jgi:hypothetical protein
MVRDHDYFAWQSIDSFENFKNKTIAIVISQWQDIHIFQSLELKLEL